MHALHKPDWLKITLGLELGIKHFLQTFIDILLSPYRYIFTF